MEWYTRYGTAYEAKNDVRNFGPHRRMLGAPEVIRSFAQGKPYDINEKKGTAKYDYEAVCTRCGGLGGGNQWAYTRWTCYECGGSGKGGTKTARLYSAEVLAKLNATQAKKDAARQEKARVEAEEAARQATEARQAFYLANREAVNALEAHKTANPFLTDLWAKLQERGSLSPAQLAAASAFIERMNTRQYVGTIGQRAEFTLSVKKIITFEPGRFGTSRKYICQDADGNTVTYTGQGRIAAEGETARVKATVSEHNEYRGEKQTEISRPKVLGVLAIRI